MGVLAGLEHSQFSDIPDELKALGQWVMWRYEDVRNKAGELRKTKVPYQAKRPGKKAMTRCAKREHIGTSCTCAQDTWCSFELANRVWLAGGYDGIGYVLSGDDGLVGIDLDHCRDSSTGRIEAWAQAIIDQMHSYTEISPSGLGLRIFTHGAIPGKRRRKGSIEIYDSARFLTVTGQHFDGTPREVTHDQDALEALVFVAFAEDEASPVTRHGNVGPYAMPANLEDGEVVRRASAAKNGARFDRLWRGDYSGYPGSDGQPDASSGDMALCARLAFWVGPDPSRIDALFRQSGLMRPKWDSPRGASTYGANTVLAIVATPGREYYSPHHGLRELGEYREPGDDSLLADIEPSYTRVTQADGSAAAAQPLPANVTPLRRREPSGSSLDEPGEGGEGGEDGGDTPTEGKYNLTELGNAERLIARYGDRVRYCYPWHAWLVWDGKRWANDTAGRLTRYTQAMVRSIYGEAEREDDDKKRADIVKHAVRSESDKAIRAAMSQAQSHRPIQPGELDADERTAWLLNCANGIIDLKGGELHEHEPGLHITKLAPVDYDAGARCPTFLRFLTEAMGGNTALVTFLQRAIGYSLTGSTREQCLFLPYGTGQNGKTTLLETLAYVLGDYATQTAPTTFMVKRGDPIPNDVAMLKGARFVSAVETEEGQRLAESLVKQITGGDMITARFMRSEFFSFRPSLKLWLATNHKPVIRGTDMAIWRRIRLIPFTVTIEHPDKELPAKLQAEAQGILAWAVQGCLDWQHDGLTSPPEVQAATEAYRGEMDAVSAFIAESCIELVNAEVGSKPLYTAYENWCNEAGERKLTKQQFNSRLRDRGYGERRGTGNIPLWQGIGLRAIEVVQGEY